MLADEAKFTSRRSEDTLLHRNEISIALSVEK